MSMFDNLKKAVADTITSDIIMVDVDDLHESADNFFEVERIEEFAETILAQGGVKENLIVMPRGSGGYEIISGHRRTAAVRHLIKNGEIVSRFLPCLIANYSDEDDKKLDIVLMNITARIISDAEMWKSYEIVNEVLQKKKALGEKFGKVQKKLAELLGVSAAQIAKIQNIDHNASEEVKEAVKNGELSISAANESIKKGTTNSTFSGNSPSEEKGTTNSTFSGNSPSEEKSATNGTFSEKPTDGEKGNHMVTFSGNPPSGEKGTTNGTFSGKTPSDEKGVTNDTFSEKPPSGEKGTTNGTFSEKPPSGEKGTTNGTFSGKPTDDEKGATNDTFSEKPTDGEKGINIDTFSEKTPSEEKGVNIDTFSEKHEAFPLFSTDVIEAFESMNLYRIVTDDKKKAILEILMNAHIRNHKEKTRRK